MFFSTNFKKVAIPLRNSETEHLYVATTSLVNKARGGADDTPPAY